ncbi:hypothetical protein Droror1_Dr00025584 [Drosera rotundifolia]
MCSVPKLKKFSNEIPNSIPLEPVVKVALGTELKYNAHDDTEGKSKNGRQAGDTYPKQRGDSSRVHVAEERLIMHQMLLPFAFHFFPIILSICSWIPYPVLV